MSIVNLNVYPQDQNKWVEGKNFDFPSEILGLPYKKSQLNTLIFF